MSMLRILVLAFFSITLISCKTPEKVQQEPAEVEESNGLAEFYGKLRTLKLEKSFKVKGSKIDAIRVLFLRSELKPVGVGEVRFRFMNYSLDSYDVDIGEIKHDSIEYDVLAGMPADYLISDFVFKCCFHIESFHDGVITINTWGKPDFMEDYEESIPKK